MQFGKHAENEKQIKLYNKTLARVDRKVSDQLTEKLRKNKITRNDWIIGLFKAEFNIDLETAEDIEKMDSILIEHLYRDRADWVMDKIRDYLKEDNKVDAPNDN